VQDKKSEREFWDSVARARVYAAFDEHEYAWAVSRIRLQQDPIGSVLDLGCASGISAAMFAQFSDSVVGVDISPELIDQARSLWADVEGLTFEVADAEDLKFPDEAFDLIFMGGVLHHFSSRGPVLRELGRVLKPGGLLVGMEPNSLDIFERIEWMIARFRGKLSPNEEPIDPNSLVIEMTQAGFELVEMEPFRSDIPFLAQFPLLRGFFGRQKGWFFKRPILTFVNRFRGEMKQGTFVFFCAAKTGPDE